MRVTQTLLFPDPRPLVELLGREFFRDLPQGPGVYLMRDGRDAVLYVGKARNLRKRLASYRVANPDRMLRRHLRMLRAVARIELQECPDETSALLREAELLFALKPRFNRAGTWRPPPRFLAWRSLLDQIELTVAESPDARWETHGPLSAGAAGFLESLARLLWLAMNPKRGVVGLPVGWAQGRIGDRIVIRCGPAVGETAEALQMLFGGQPRAFCEWFEAKMPAGASTFEKAVVVSDLESLADCRSIGAIGGSGPQVERFA